MASNKTVKMDFFSSAKRMTLAQVKKFLTEVQLQMDPKLASPVVLWSAPGCAKSCVLTEIFSKHKNGLITVIASQIGPLDSNGLPRISTITVKDEETGEVKEVEVTKFTPTMTFGRGFNNVFLDELNNSAPSTLAALQNMLSARTMGGDSFENSYIIAACNPPSTNSLANDLNHPTVSRCLNIVLDYTLDDFISYAMECGTIHPSVIAFHKKTNGQYLQANWEVVKNHGYLVPEPGANEPFPCPRTWEKVSDYLNAMSSTGKLEYGLLQPIIEGLVGIQAASSYATTYAYMNRLPDIAPIFKGTVTEIPKLNGEVAIEYLTAFSASNYCICEIEKAKRDGIKCIFPKDPTEKKTPAWNLIAGIHRLIQFVNTSCSPELGTIVITAVSEKIRTLPGSFLPALYSDIDPKNGLTRVKTFCNASTTQAENRNNVMNAF